MINSKRVLFLSLNDKMGGAEQVLKMVAAYYLQCGFKIDILFLTKSKGNLWDDLKGESLNCYYTDKLSEKRGLFQLLNNLYKLRHNEYEYAFTSHIYLNSLLGIVKKNKLIKIRYAIGRDSHSYYIVDSGIKKMMYQFLINIGYSGLDLLVSQTGQMREQMIINNKRLSKKTKIINIPNPFKFISKDETPLPVAYQGRHFIVSAGRLIKIKGFDILINAFEKLLVSLPHLSLIILGEGEERPNLEQTIKDKNLETKVFLNGYTENVYPYFKNAEMCVVSSLAEGFPNVLLQMMSQNNRVVCTKCAGDIENIQGLFFADIGSVESLYYAMKSSLNGDNEHNANLFEKELKSRSINGFITKIQNVLNE